MGIQTLCINCGISLALALCSLHKNELCSCAIFSTGRRPFYSNNGTHSTPPFMVYIYLPYSAHLCTQLLIGTHVSFQPNMAWWIYMPIMAHLCTQLPIGMHVPFQPNMAQNSFHPFLAENSFELFLGQFLLQGKNAIFGTYAILKQKPCNFTTNTLKGYLSA